MVIDTLLTFLLVLVTLAPLSRHPAWWIRVWDFPRLQLLAISAFLTLLPLFFIGTHPLQSTLLLLISLACCGYQCWWIFPYSCWGKSR